MAVLLSVRPKWCELIASGKKTVEIRKTRPKIETPFKCVVRITYFFRTKQRHDPDNYNGKFILDGLREAGIIEDDSFSNVELQLCGSYDKKFTNRNNYKRGLTMHESND